MIDKILNFKKGIIVSLVLISWSAFAFADTQEAFPKIDIKGYKRWAYDKIDILPTANYGSYISSAEALKRGYPWSENLNLYINAVLTPDLNVDYYIYQNPLSPDQCWVGIKYKLENQLIFGDFRSPQQFGGRELGMTYYDSVNGLIFQGRTGNLNYEIAPIGILQTTKNATYISTAAYNLFFSSSKFRGSSIGVGSIADSRNFEYWALTLDQKYGISDIQLSMDEEKMYQGVDFFISNGKILFPSKFLSKRSANVTYKANGIETSRTFNIAQEARRQAFYLNIRTLDQSERITLDGRELIRNLDYYIDYELGLVVLKKPAAEDAEISIDYQYVYTPVKQEFIGGSLQYSLFDWNQTGLSIYEVVPDKSSSYTALNPAKFDVLKLTSQAELGEQTKISGEISLSNTAADSRTSSTTTETGAAYNVEIHTRVGNLVLDLLTKNIGSAFASTQRVREGKRSQYGETSLKGEYFFFDNLSVSLGYQASASEEAAVRTDNAATIFGLNWKPWDIALLQADFQNQIQNLVNSSTQSLYGKIDLSKYLPGTSNSDIIFKYFNNEAQNTSRSSKMHYGWQTKFVNGLSGYLDYANSNTANLVNNTSSQFSNPYLKLGYNFRFPHMGDFQLYGDYSPLQCRGANESYDKTSSSYSFFMNIPYYDNPVLTGVRLGMEFINTNYVDLLNAGNNYLANEIRFEGDLLF